MGVIRKVASSKPVVKKTSAGDKPVYKGATLNEVKIKALPRYSADTSVTVGGVGKPSLTVPKRQLDSIANTVRGAGAGKDIKKSVAAGKISQVKHKGTIKTNLNVSSRGDAGSNTYELAKKLKKK